MLFQLTGSQITETYLKEYLLSGRAAERTVVCTWRLPRRRWSMFNLPQDSKRHFYCRREISSPVSTFVSVRLSRLSSLHFNFYTFLNQDRCSRRRDFLSFTSSSLKSATYITDDAVCSSTQSPSTHMFCGFVPSSTLRIPPVAFQKQSVMLLPRARRRQSSMVLLTFYFKSV